jgi:outer membrane lipoprotein-sorting protein
MAKECTMKKVAVKTGIMLLLAGVGCSAKDAAPAAPAPAPAAAPAGEMSADAALDALDQRGQGLKSFDADVKLTETDESTQLSSTRTGHVWFQKKPADDARLRVLLDKKEDKTKIIDEKIEYLLDGGWLDDRDYNKRIEVRRQILKPGEKVNLLKLGEGPFPLPIGQKKEDVKKLFDVTKVKPDKEDPAGTVHLELKPIKGTQFARKFSAIDVWVDTKTGMPRRIDTLDLKQTTTRSTELTDVRINPDLTDADFNLEKIQAQNWNVHEEPFGE